MLRRVDVLVTEVEVDGEIAVYHPGTDKVVLLNSSVSEIWRRIPASFEQVVDEVARAFGLEPEEARDGVAAGLRLLRDEQLVTVDDDHAPSHGA